MNRQVFVSYSTKDARQAEQVRAYLEDNDVRCWIAPRDMVAGEHFLKQIERAITDCEVTVLLVSENANESQYVVHELEYALGLGKPVLALELTNVSPSPEVGQLLAACHKVDVRGHLLSRNLPRVLQAVRRLLPVAAPAQAPSRAETPQVEAESSRAGVLVPSS